MFQDNEKQLQTLIKGPTALNRILETYLPLMQQIECSLALLVYCKWNI